MPPRISVVMSVYNGQAYLMEAIESILNQKFGDFEFLIVDDASTDDTPKILQRFAAGDPRIRILTHTENRGLTASLNHALQQAQGKYIARQDADDVSLPHRLGDQIALLDQNSNVVLVSGNLILIDAHGTPIGYLERAASPNMIRWKMLFYNHVSAHSQVMFRRQAALDCGGYDEALPYSQDYNLWRRMLGQGDIWIAPKVWVHFRQHGDSISQTRFEAQEKISLRESQQAMQALGYALADLETLAQLRAFWLEPFPKFGYRGTIYHHLSELWEHFQQHHKLTSTDRRAIKTDISDQWRRWARSISIRRHPWQKLRLWADALRWRV